MSTALEPILEETSLVPCAVRPVPARIEQLAYAIQALDQVGARRVLRSVRDAADRDLGDGCGLRTWCFNRATPRDAGRLVASRLASQPFVDGPNGLFAAVEGQRAVDARVNGATVVGAGLAALTDGIVLILASEARSGSEKLDVVMTILDDEGMRDESVQLRTFAKASEIVEERPSLVRRLDLSVTDGALLISRMGELLPRIKLGALAREQIAKLSGTEQLFRQLIRHLRALDEGAMQWEEGKPFEPVAVPFSVESKVTLEDGNLGPMRDFPTPEGFPAERWSLHTKLTGEGGARLYFRPVRSADRALVLVGYFGKHLPTTKYRT